MMKISVLSFLLLPLTTTVASAEVTLSGDARLGVTNAFQHTPGVDDPTAFSSRARIAFTMSGETDGGLAFGAALRADNAAGAATGIEGAVILSGAFGKLSMGDVDGAAEAAVGQVDPIGFAGVGSGEELVYFGTGGTRLAGLTPSALPQAVVGTDASALYEYSVGSLSLFASSTNPNGTFSVPNPAPAPADVFRAQAYSLGASYSIDAFKVSLGFEDVRVKRIIPAAPPINAKITNAVIGADASFGQISLKARYAKAKLNDTGLRTTFKQSAVSATYRTDALSITGFLANKNFSLSSGVLVASFSTYGLGASYDLAGGATISGGIAKEVRSFGGVNTKDTAFDLGVRFAF